MDEILKLLMAGDLSFMLTTFLGALIVWLSNIQVGRYHQKDRERLEKELEEGRKNTAYALESVRSMNEKISLVFASIYDEELNSHKRLWKSFVKLQSSAEVVTWYLNAKAKTIPNEHGEAFRNALTDFLFAVNESQPFCDSRVNAVCAQIRGLARSQNFVARNIQNLRGNSVFNRAWENYEKIQDLGDELCKEIRECAKRDPSSSF